MNIILAVMRIAQTFALAGSY